MVVEYFYISCYSIICVTVLLQKFSLLFLFVCIRGLLKVYYLAHDLVIFNSYKKPQSHLFYDYYIYANLC